MPDCGIDHMPRNMLLTYEEMIRLCRVFSSQGISKLRITGGEPFVSKNFMYLLSELSTIPDIHQIHITSNGTLLGDKIESLSELGITSINLSLDSLDRKRFHEITRRDELATVLENLQLMIDHHFDVKINMVVMADKNVEDIYPMLELARDRDISIRFLEEMPFNGLGLHEVNGFWSHKDILDHILAEYKGVKVKKSGPNSTSTNYSIDGFKGDFGIIASYSKTFCSSCNRIRITPQGMLKTCLYDEGIFNLRDFLRAGATDEQITNILHESISQRAKDGFEAEKRRMLNPSVSESMATIGG